MKDSPSATLPDADRRTTRLMALAAAVAFGGAWLCGVYVATGWSVRGQLETAARQISNRAAKQDRLPWQPASAVSARASPGIDIPYEPGRATPRNDPSRHETVVARVPPGPEHPADTETGASGAAGDDAPSGPGG